MPPGFPRGRPNRAEVVSGLARICGRRAHKEREVAGEVARSSAAPLLALAEAGPGFPSIAVFGFRFFAVQNTLSAPYRAWRVGRAGVPSSAGHSLLSWNTSRNRKPAQHKGGFPSELEGNPVERAIRQSGPRNARQRRFQIRPRPLQDSRRGQRRPAPRTRVAGKVR